MNLFDAFNKISDEISKRSCHNYLRPDLILDQFNEYPHIALILKIKDLNGNSYSWDLLWNIEEKLVEESYYQYLKNKIDKIEKEFNDSQVIYD